jgi:hypothetical protein
MHGYQSPQKIELFQLFQSYIMSALQAVELVKEHGIADFANVR